MTGRPDLDKVTRLTDLVIACLPQAGTLKKITYISRPVYLYSALITQFINS